MTKARKPALKSGTPEAKAHPVVPRLVNRSPDKSQVEWKLDRLQRDYEQGGNFTLLFDALQLCHVLDRCPEWVARELYKLGRGWYVPPRGMPKQKGRACGTWRQRRFENLKHIARASFFEEILVAGYTRSQAKDYAAEYFRGTKAAGAGETMLRSYRIVTRGRARNASAWGVLSRFDNEYTAREYEPTKQQREAFFAALPTNQLPPAKPKNPTAAASAAYERECLRWRKWAERQAVRRLGRLGQLFSEIARWG